MLIVSYQKEKLKKKMYPIYSGIKRIYMLRMDLIYT